MRIALKSSNEVFHFWANKIQPEGRAGNVFFENETVYSYGRHFAIARHLPSGKVAFTTRGYSNSTAKHIGKARSAASHLQIVYCNDPSDSTEQNMRHAEAAIVDALNAADKPRIRQTTKDKCKAQALHIAEQANAYLAAVGATDRIDTSALEHIREVMAKHEAAQRAAREASAIARNAEAAERLIAWRTDPTIRTDGFYQLPVALRLQSADEREFRIQTSHGAEIPVSFASRLWAMIGAARKAGASLENIGKPCGHYTLNTIRADGSIVVGCHDIAYAEIRRIAVLLGFIGAEEAI